MVAVSQAQQQVCGEQSGRLVCLPCLGPSQVPSTAILRQEPSAHISVITQFNFADGTSLLHPPKSVMVTPAGCCSSKCASWTLLSGSFLCILDALGRDLLKCENKEIIFYYF